MGNLHEKSHLIFIDGPPGSGKSSLAMAMAEAAPGYKVFLEMDRGHPLHPIPVVGAGADFAELSTWEPRKLADHMLAKWEAFLTQSGSSILESYPYQSHLRVLWQMNAPKTLLDEWLQRLYAMLQDHDPMLAMMHFGDFDDEFQTVCERRGEEWTSYVMDFVQTTAYSRCHGIHSREGAMDFFRAYQLQVAEWSASWPFKKVDFGAWDASPTEHARLVIRELS